MNVVTALMLFNGQGLWVMYCGFQLPYIITLLLSVSNAFEELVIKAYSALCCRMEVIHIYNESALFHSEIYIFMINILQRCLFFRVDKLF